MKILHINSNYFYNEFYENQLDVLDNSVENIIFNPLRQSIKVIVNINIIIQLL